MNRNRCSISEIAVFARFCFQFSNDIEMIAIRAADGSLARHFKPETGLEAHVVPTLQVDDAVLLTQDMPELWLPRGTEGVVRSVWFSPTLVYEVEFTAVGLNCGTRALLLENSIERLMPQG
jgi:hypothetical protein